MLGSASDNVFVTLPGGSGLADRGRSVNPCLTDRGVCRAQDGRERERPPKGDAISAYGRCSRHGDKDAATEQDRLAALGTASAASFAREESIVSNRIVICLFPVLVVVLTPAIGHAGPPSNSMQFFGCASEGGACTIGNLVDIGGTQATKLVAYGDAASSRWVYRNMSGSFVCSNATFGDPAPGATKTCLFAPYQFAASEGGSYSIFASTPGLAIAGVNVAYGRTAPSSTRWSRPAWVPAAVGVSASSARFPATTARSGLTPRQV